MSATWLRDWCIFYKAKTVFADVSNRNKLHHATCDINIRADFVLILGLILVHLVQIRAANFVLFLLCFFFQILPRWVLSFLKHVSGSSFDFFIFVNFDDNRHNLKHMVRK